MIPFVVGKRAHFHPLCMDTHFAIIQYFSSYFVAKHALTNHYETQKKSNAIFLVYFFFFFARIRILSNAIDGHAVIIFSHNLSEHE